MQIVILHIHSSDNPGHTAWRPIVLKELPRVGESFSLITDNGMFTFYVDKIHYVIFDFDMRYDGKNNKQIPCSVRSSIELHVSGPTDSDIEKMDELIWKL